MVYKKKGYYHNLLLMLLLMADVIGGLEGLNGWGWSGHILARVTVFRFALLWRREQFTPNPRRNVPRQQPQLAYMRASGVNEIKGHGGYQIDKRKGRKESSQPPLFTSIPSFSTSSYNNILLNICVKPIGHPTTYSLNYDYSKAKGRGRGACCSSFRWEWGGRRVS